MTVDSKRQRDSSSIGKMKLSYYTPIHVIAAIGILLQGIETFGVALPINAQFPPIARTNEQYHFVFSEGTLSGATHESNFTLQHAPAWLEVDSDSRTLGGSPREKDTGSHNFDLVAEHESGDSTVLPVTLIVSHDEGASLKKPAKDQIASQGLVASADTLILHPASTLSLSFAKDTFEHVTKSTSYHATCIDNTPLPSWTSFEPTSLTFSGKVPEQTSPLQLPQEIGIRLIASDTPGFSSAATYFRIIISRKTLAFNKSLIQIQVTPGQELSSNDLNTLTIDGQPASADNLTAPEMPQWLSIDPRSLVYGKTPENFNSTSFTVSARSQDSNVANTTVKLISKRMSSTLVNVPDFLEARMGEYFSYSFKKDSESNLDKETRVDSGNASSWLHFDSSRLTIAGQVPRHSKPHEEQLVIKFKQGANTEQKVIKLRIKSTIVTEQPKQPEQTTTSSRPDPPRSSNQGAQFPFPQIEGINSKTTKIVVGILCPVLVITGLFVVVLCLKKRKAAAARASFCKNLPSPPKSCFRKPNLRKSGISRPVNQRVTWEDTSSSSSDIPRSVGAGPATGEVFCSGENNTGATQQISSYDSYNIKRLSLHQFPTLIDIMRQSNNMAFLPTSTQLSQSTDSHKNLQTSNKTKKSLRSVRAEDQVRISRQQFQHVSGVPLSRRPSGMGHGSPPPNPALAPMSFAGSPQVSMFPSEQTSNILAELYRQSDYYHTPAISEATTEESSYTDTDGSITCSEPNLTPCPKKRNSSHEIKPLQWPTPPSQAALSAQQGVLATHRVAKAPNISAFPRIVPRTPPGPSPTPLQALSYLRLGEDGSNRDSSTSSVYDRVAQGSGALSRSPSSTSPPQRYGTSTQQPLVRIPTGTSVGATPGSDSTKEDDELDLILESGPNGNSSRKWKITEELGQASGHADSPRGSARLALREVNEQRPRSVIRESDLGFGRTRSIKHEAGKSFI